MDIEVDGRRAHAATGSRAINADEPAVILIHGAGLDRTIWQLQTRNIAYIGRQVYALDMPGHGRSEGEPLQSIEDMAEWVSRFMEAAQIKSATIIGHSLGALAAIEIAARYPDKADKLVLMGIAELMPVHPELLAAAEANETRASELIVYWGLGEKAQTGGHPHPGLWVHGASLNLLENAKPGALYSDLVACDRYRGALAAAQKVGCDVLFVLGRDDKMTPPQKARPLIEAVEKARTVTIERCGHMLMSERPNQVYDALRGFV